MSDGRFEISTRIRNTFVEAAESRGRRGARQSKPEGDEAAEARSRRGARQPKLQGDEAAEARGRRGARQPKPPDPSVVVGAKLRGYL